MPSVGSGSGPSKTVPGAGWALALLIGINLFNYIDRRSEERRVGKEC